MTQWDEGRLQALCDSSAEETLSLEFKETLELNKRKQRKELAKDVSAMANAAGGTIIFGIAESSRDGATVAARIKPLTDRDLIDKMDDVFHSSITPPVGVAFEKIDVTGGYCIALHISPSDGVLHQVAAYDDYAFYRRTEKGARPMDAREVQREFESIVRTRATYDETVSEIMERELASADRPFARVVLVPLNVVGDLVDVTRGRPEDPIGHPPTFTYYKLKPSRDGWETDKFGTPYTFRVRRSGVVQYVAPWADPSHWSPEYVMNAVSRACSLARSFWMEPFVEACAVTVIDSHADLVWRIEGWDALVVPEGRTEIRTQLPRNWNRSPVPIHRAVADRLGQAAGCERSPLHDASGTVTATGRRFIQERADG